MFFFLISSLLLHILSILWCYFLQAYKCPITCFDSSSWLSMGAKDIFFIFFIPKTSNRRDFGVALHVYVCVWMKWAFTMSISQAHNGVDAASPPNHYSTIHISSAKRLVSNTLFCNAIKLLSTAAIQRISILLSICNSISIGVFCELLCWTHLSISSPFSSSNKRICHVSSQAYLSQSYQCTVAHLYRWMK